MVTPKSGAANITIVRDQMTLVVKNIPAQVCENCGEEYVEEAVVARLEVLAEEAAKAGVQVDVREHSPAAA